MSIFTRTPGNYFVSNSATLTGDVTIGELCSFWFSVVVRGDVAPITLGKRVNVQDGVVIHCDTGVANVIEDDVSIGHRAVVHGKRVGRGTLIGMGAIVMGETTIGSECIIGAGSVVPPGMDVPDRSVVMGVPGRVIRTVREADLKHLQWLTNRYVELVGKYMAGEIQNG